MTSGFEVSGVVDELCPTVDVSKVSVGDHVIVYPTDEEESTESGYLRLFHITLLFQDFFRH